MTRAALDRLVLSALGLVAIFLATGLVTTYIRSPDRHQAEANVRHGLFKIDAWGDPVGDGLSGALYCTISGVAKRNSPESPHAVPNEYICGRLGYMIGLPIPPGVVVQTDDGVLAYVSLKFRTSSERPPAIIPPEFVADNIAVAAGVVVFDCWIANLDRHDENLAYSRFGIQPVVFDHDRALLGTDRDPISRLTSYRDEGLAGSCLTEHLGQEAEAHMRSWSERIRAIRNDHIKEICEHMVCDGGIDQATCDAAVEFLVYRKDRLPQLLFASEDDFPNITQRWLA